MYGPLNISTMKPIKHWCLVLLLAAVALNTANAQRNDNSNQVVVNDIEHSQNSPYFFDVFTYAATGSIKHANLWTATQNSSTKSRDIHGKFFDIGMTGELYFTKGESISTWASWKPRIKASVGYKYERYAHDNGFFGNSGIHTHWLTSDLNLSASLLCTGIKSDIFLASHSKNKFSGEYAGFNKECFNPMSLCWYFGFCVRFSFLSLELRMGSYITPQIDPNAIAYYNLGKTHVDAKYWEARASFLLFTTKRR